MAIDWAKVFTPDISLLEIFVRGTCVYWALLLMLRFGSKREAGSVGLADMLVIVVIADAAQNAMSSTYTSVTDGVFLVGTILLWDYFIDWMTFRFPAVEKVLKPSSVCLIRERRILWRNLRAEMITEKDMMEQLRLLDVHDINNVKRAVMESNGKISVVKYKD